MSGVDSEFGEVDEDDLLIAATQAEGRAPTSEEDSSPRARKRRRIERNETFKSQGSEDVLGLEESSSQGSLGLFVTQESQESQPLKSTEKEKPETPEEKVRKHRIHIPKNGNLLEDSFHTQISRSSESPYRIRGPIWRKPKSPSPVPQPTRERSPRPNDKSISVRAIALAKAPQPKPIPTSRSTAVKENTAPKVTSYEDELADLPSDAFESSDEDRGKEVIEISSQKDYEGSWKNQNSKPRQVGPQKNMRQTTLFGTQHHEQVPQSTQSNKAHNWPLANKHELPTHHKLDSDALRTWVYPTNLGTTRDYQFNIVARGLYHNLLVALPTGLGKTFIAATVMLNWFRWTEDSQIVFVAPTKPLVSQQVDACFHIAGIPRSATTMLTGNTPPGVRAEEWVSKRVFFMTPQTILNDLKKGIADPKRIVLLVVDEAHRATGAYAYVEVVKFLRRFNQSFRVLGLTATPGSTIESVQEVIDGLDIARVEIRTENSLDIRKYVHQRNIDTLQFDPSDDMIWIMDKFSKTLQPLVDKLRGMNAYWSKDPMSLTAYGCTQSRQRWMGSDAGRNANIGVKGMVNSIFNILASLAHAIELLRFHGVTPFYHKLVNFQKETMENGAKASKYRRQVTESEHFKDLMFKVKTWVLKPDFVGHPKLEYLQGVVLEHFVATSEGRNADPSISPNKTRIMVFAHFRDSAEEIVRVLNRNTPMIRPHVFVGQASSAGSEGMGQKKQLEIIEKFRNGTYNTLVATSIGEEGLDIGEVDLIICYDASASPIRMLQRMGRTGRKRAGNIVVLLMKGKEDDNFTKAKDNYEKMQGMIADGRKFTFHDDLSPRIVPKDIQPVVDKCVVEIPIENSQALVEPKKRGRPPKCPPKKFHMPDGVRTGFTKASRLNDDSGSEDLPLSRSKRKAKVVEYRSPSPEAIPPLASVLLCAKDQQHLERHYLHIAGDSSETVEPPRLDAFPKLQRRPRPTVLLEHSNASKRLVRTMNAISKITMATVEKLKDGVEPEDPLVSMSDARGQNKPQSSPGNYHISKSTHGAPQELSDHISIDGDSVSNDPDTSVNEMRGGSPGIETGDEIASPLSTPPPLERLLSKPFYVPPAGGNEVDSSQDLPDVSTLVRKQRNVIEINDVEEERPAITGRGKKRRMMVESDSDG